MIVLIALLTLAMGLDCLALIFLVLLQLPKKDAGAGLAFGGSATDALFGAGSGNVLTKITKYAAIIFFVLAIVLGMMQSRYHRGGNAFTRALAAPGAPAAPAPTAPASATRPAVEDTKMPATPPATAPAPATPAATPATPPAPSSTPAK
jgi:preprotein translocase subunit SecG